MPQASAFPWACAFHDGAATALTDQTLDWALADPVAWVWAHLPLSDQRSRTWLENFDEVPAAARDLILRRMRIMPQPRQLRTYRVPGTSCEQRTNAVRISPDAEALQVSKRRVGIMG